MKNVPVEAPIRQGTQNRGGGSEGGGDLVIPGFTANGPEHLLTNDIELTDGSE